MTTSESVVADPVLKSKTGPSDVSKTTLFIRNVPFDCENGEFETFFSEFGPLKGCFVVKDPTQEGRCRGIGFVHFALAEDAEKTMKALEAGEAKFRGRSLQADWAQRKNMEFSGASVTRVKKTEASAPKARPIVLVEAERMQECTKLILEVEQDLSADSKLLKALLQRLRRFAPIKSHLWPHEEDPRKILLEYALPKTNYMVYRKLFPKINSCLLHSTIDDSGENRGNKLFVGRSCLLKSVEPVLPEPIKAFRLIIRNLPFNITRPTQLIEYFAPYGEIVEINVPTTQNESSRFGASDAIRGRGFGFVQYAKRTDAEKAMEALNGSIVKSRAIAVDWALAKSVYDKLESKPVEEEQGDEPVEEEEEVDNESINDSEIDIESESENDNDIDIDIDDSINSTNSTVFIRNLSFETEEDDLQAYFESKLPGCRIEYCKVVRNGDTGASRGTAFIKFTKSKFAREAVEISSRAPMVMSMDAQLADLAEKRTKKGFKSIVSDPDALMMTMTMNDSNDGDNEVVRQPCGFLLNGRLLDVTLAVNRGEAADLGRRRALDKISSVLDEEGRDRILDQLFCTPINKRTTRNDSEGESIGGIPRLKRNLALINESVPDASKDPGLPTSELKARESVIQNRARSSAKNPNLMLSATRLAVHHLPPRVLEDQLKEVVYAGMKEARAVALSPGNPLNLSKKMLKLLPEFEACSKIHSGIHQIKIIQHKSKKEKDSDGAAENPDKKDTSKSRGYGFIEWRHPLMALICVRWFRLSTSWTRSGISQMIQSRARALARDFPNDPDAQISIPVVEFATEKLNVLKKRSSTGGKAGKSIKRHRKE